MHVLDIHLVVCEDGSDLAQFAWLVRQFYDYGIGTTKALSESARLYRLAAERGDAHAQFCLGTPYSDGVAVDHAEAIRWLRMAVDQGYNMGQNAFGRCYYHGWGVAKDFATAVRWFRLAADQGNAVAQYNLGGCYETGEGVAVSIAEAKRWYRLAADQGYEDAKAALRRLGN